MQGRVRRSGGLEVAEGVLARVRDVEEPRQSVGLASGCMLRAARPLADVGQATGNSPVLILVLLVDAAHQGSGWRQNLIDEDEDGLLRGELDPLPDDVDELADGEICWYEVLLLVDGSDIALLDLFADDLEGECVSDAMWEGRVDCAGGQASRPAPAGFTESCRARWFTACDARTTYRNAVRVLLADAFGLSLALLEGVLVLKLAAHFGGCEDEQACMVGCVGAVRRRGSARPATSGSER